MITRKRGYLRVREGGAPPASAQLEHEGYAVLRRALSPQEVAELRADVLRVFAELPPDIRRPDAPAGLYEEFRYEMLNRSEVCQRAIGDRRILDVIEPLLGEDCHVIANTAWRNPAQKEHQHGGGFWHIDAGPHVPRPAGVPWDERIPYPIFAVGVHILLKDCTEQCGPTAVLPGSHRSGQAPPRDRAGDTVLEWDGTKPLVLTGQAGDLLLFASDIWHRRMPTGPEDQGRLFLQVHYGRRDIAQRLRPTEATHQISSQALERAREPRERTVIGLHAPFFYDG